MPPSSLPTTKTGLKIVSIDAIPVNIPRTSVLGEGFRSSLGSARVSEYVIVLVKTDAGIVGLGEASSVFARRGKVLHQEIASFLAPALIGENPFDIARLVDRMNVALDGAEPSKAALEMALWDIKGKALETPVFELLGGRSRERIGLSFSIPFAPPAEAATFAAELVQKGFKTVKLKVGKDFENDIATVKQVRKAVGPDIRVRLDANMGFSDVKRSLAFIERIADYDPEMLEQPLAQRDLSGMAYLRDQAAIRIMADESVWTPYDAMEVIRHRAADVVSVYVSEAGGLLNAWRCFAICNAAGIPCVIGSMPELGIGTAAAIHLGLSANDLPFDCDACGALYHTDDLILTPIRSENGFSYAPEGSGLGVELDHDALERFRAR